MAITYSDHEIQSFVQERKRLPADWRRRTRMVSKRGHQERQLDITGNDGTEFRLILRHGTINTLDFSVILGIRIPQSNQVFRLRRYNGKSHQHTNHIEASSFYDFHIHLATERYQEFGTREDAYAEPTDRYESFQGALSCLLADANFDIPPEPQRDIFEEDSDVH